MLKMYDHASILLDGEGAVARWRLWVQPSRDFTSGGPVTTYCASLLKMGSGSRNTSDLATSTALSLTPYGPCSPKTWSEFGLQMYSCPSGPIFIDSTIPVVKLHFCSPSVPIAITVGGPVPVSVSRWAAT